MACSRSLIVEENFQCSICLSVFTKPVSIPCGHNFCFECISNYWDTTKTFPCPLCKEEFLTKPMLRVNTVIAEMAAKLKSKVQEKSTGISEQAGNGNVFCTMCTGARAAALKSCLVCFMSLCEEHLKPHQTILALKKHKLINPVENLENRICETHEEPLELFCKVDHMFVCGACKDTDHKNHKIVTLEEEAEMRKTQLGNEKTHADEMIQSRQQKIQEIQKSMDASRNNAAKALSCSLHVTTALADYIKRSQAELTKPQVKDWSDVTLTSDQFEVQGALAKLETTVMREVSMLCDPDLKEKQQHAVDVTLDPDTAHPQLAVSADGKQVTHGGRKRNVPNKRERFDHVLNVMAKEGFSSGKFYYEVQVKDKPQWDLGVVNESINRKGDIRLSPKNGYWTIWLRKGHEFTANTGPAINLPVREVPQKVGVFVDYEQGQVSFYDVDTKANIFSFTGCNFTEKLFPFFSPCANDDGKNSAPLIIAPVKYNN
ncbi:zinc-binding protein A33-like isoform X2 [Trachinotus anak]|uniref:zinc-binding protein A33-like isoform X2 n=1 Tax=Trachinotus anak TaxID=443729 RepID=UPI0039F2506E